MSFSVSPKTGGDHGGEMYYVRESLSDYSKGQGAKRLEVRDALL